MNVMTRIELLSVIAAVVVGDSSHAVAEEPATVKGLQMSVEFDREVYGAGEMVWLEVIIANPTKEEVSLGMSADDLSSFEFVVKYTGGGMAQAGGVPMTRYGAEVLAQYAAAKNIESRLKPGQTMKYEFPLNRVLDLSATGTYSVTVKRCVPGKARYDGVGKPLPPEMNVKLPPELVSIEQSNRIAPQNGVVRSLEVAPADSSESDVRGSN